MGLGIATMKSKSFFLLVAAVLVTSIFFSMNARQRSSIYQETQVQLKNLQRNFDADKAKKKLIEVEPEYLELLGLTEEDAKETLWPNSAWQKFKNASVPVIVSAVQNGHAGEAVHFIRNANHFLPNHTVIVYDLGLSSHEVELVGRYCNSSSCQVPLFDTLELPSHIRDFSNGAFRPIIIQQVLKHAGCILWVNIDQRFTGSKLEPVMTCAEQSGIQTWLGDTPEGEEQLPTSAKTHPKMIARLVANEKTWEDYNFQHMVDLKALLVFNRPRLYHYLIKPWVKCALLLDCLVPLGAQANGCRYDKKPRFRYSGCHSYEVSALNVLLGQLFGFDEHEYISRERIFVPMEEEVEAEHDVEDAYGFNGTTMMTPLVRPDETGSDFEEVSGGIMMTGEEKEEEEEEVERESKWTLK